MKPETGNLFYLALSAGLQIDNHEKDVNPFSDFCQHYHNAFTQSATLFFEAYKYLQY